MIMLMSYQMALITESLIAYFTTIGALTTMHALMSYQTTRVTE